MSAIRIAAKDELWIGEKKHLLVGKYKIVLINHEGTLYAYEDRCAHLGVPLSEGSICGKVLTCRAHQWQYDVETGKGINPQKAQLRSFSLSIVGEDVLINLPDEDPEA